jgi:ribose-phosphate pyrophosphokinase
MQHTLNPEEVRIFSGSSHPTLAADIADYLSVPLDPTFVSRFSNDNLYVQLGSSVRGRVVHIIQSLIPPVSEHLMELFMMLDIARGAGASEIHAIVPYFSYARSDKKDAPRISITARLIADLLQASGATHFMTMTLHSPQVHGFFNIPTDPLTARHLFVWHYKEKPLNPNETIVISPDVGRAKSAARFASRLGLPVAAAQKLRVSDNQVLITDIFKRQVEGYRKALIYDDEIATGGTVLELCRLLAECNIEEISLICTHGLFTENALPRLAAIPQIKEIITTDTVPPASHHPSILKVLSVASVFGEAIWRNYHRKSIGDLFTYSEEKDEQA